jgi:hypothetical protein
MRLNILLADEWLDRADMVVAALERAGLRIENVATAVGVITGSTEGDRRDDLARVRGVAAVELVRDVHVAPPERDPE